MKSLKDISKNAGKTLTALALVGSLAGCMQEKKPVYIPISKSTTSDFTSKNYDRLNSEIRSYVTFQPQNDLNTFSKFSDFSGIGQDQRETYQDKSVWINVVKNPESYEKIDDGEHFVNIYLSEQEGVDLLAKIKQAYENQMSDKDFVDLPSGGY